jgi:hypothetical protein
MKKLKVDMESLIESFSLEGMELFKEYLDSHTGDVINIPTEVEKVVGGEAEIETLDDWMRDLVCAAEEINKDTEHRYIAIPMVETKFIHNLMVDFTNEIVRNDKLEDELRYTLNTSNPMRSFKDALRDFEGELDQWYTYEEEKTKEYVIQWLREHDIELE